MKVSEIISRAKEKYPGFSEYLCFSSFVIATNRPDLFIEGKGQTTLKDPNALIIFNEK